MIDQLKTGQAYQEFQELHQQFLNNPDSAAIRSFAETHAEDYIRAMQNERYASWDKALHSVGSTAPEIILNANQQMADTITYMTDSEPLTAHQLFDLDTSSIDWTKTAAPVPQSKSAGHGTYSAYVTSSQPQMNAGNAKEIDYNVLSELAYAAKFNNHGAHAAEYRRATQREGVTVKEYCEGLLQYLDDTEENMENRIFLEELANSERYGGLTIDHAIGRVDSSHGSQAQVLVVGCGDGHGIMVVEGTNGTTKDWETNGDFIGSDPGAEEQWVNSVTNEYAGEYDTIDITGHSQGGREAVTAGMFMDRENQDKIKKIVSNDGPGYSNDFINKHQDRISVIEGRVTNVRPTGSFVGTLEKPVGEVKYVRTVPVVTGYDNGEEIFGNLHSGFTWYVDANGDYVEASQEFYSKTIAEVTPALTDFLSVYLSDEELSGYVARVFDLFGMENGELSFNPFATPDGRELTPGQKLDRGIKFITKLTQLGNDFSTTLKARIDQVNQEQLSDAEYGLLIFCQSYNDVYDKIGLYLKGTEKILALIDAAVAPTGIGAVIVSTALAVLEIVNVALKVIDVVCTIGKIILTAIAYARARKEKEARDSYIGSNPEIKVNISALESAGTHLYNAANWLGKADSSYDGMLSHFKNKIKEKILQPVADGASMVSEPLGEIVESVSSVSKLDAIAYCFTRGVTSVGDSTIGKLRHAVNVFTDVKGNAERAVSAAQLSEGSFFRVDVTGLGGAAADGIVQGDRLGQERLKINDQITSLCQAYQGEDADSLKTKWTEYDDNLQKLQTNYNAIFSNLAEIVKMYKQFQEKAIQSFQQLKL